MNSNQAFNQNKEMIDKNRKEERSYLADFLELSFSEKTEFMQELAHHMDVEAIKEDYDDEQGELAEIKKSLIQIAHVQVQRGIQEENQDEYNRADAQMIG